MSEPHASTAGALLVAAAAPLTGDYSVIIFSALVGSLWPLAAADTKTRKQGAFLMFRLALTAAVLTSFVAWVIESNLNVPAAKVLGPVALAIGAMGNRWQSVFDSVGALIARVLGALGGRQ